MRFRRIMIFGIGVVGGHLTDLLSRAPEDYEIIVVARDEQRLRERTNLAITVAMNAGKLPRVRYAVGDLEDVARTAELLDRERPEIVVNVASHQTFWLISTLPRPLYEQLDAACVGPWLPHHLALARKLMLAVRESAIDCRVVNVAFPDAVNAALAGAGLAPMAGAGNVANAVPTLRRAAALMLGAPVEAVQARFYAHHYVGNRIAGTGDPGDAPYILSVLLDGVDVTGRLDVPALFRLFTSRLKRTRGVPGQVVAASSAAAVVRAVANDSGELLHVPGPNGLPGGYPVRVDAHRVEVVTDAASLEEAVRVNQRAQVYEGISRIDPDGTVHFTEANMEVLRRTLGYHRRSMALDEADACAAELRDRYHRFVEGRTVA